MVYSCSTWCYQDCAFSEWNFHHLMLLYCNYTEYASIKPMYIIRSALSVARMQRVWLCHQFCYPMFTLLIVKLFEKCVFVLRTELMVWENGPISYIVLTIDKRAIQDSYPTLLLVFVIGILLLFRLIWQKGLYPWWKGSERRESDHQTITGWISDKSAQD